MPLPDNFNNIYNQYIHHTISGNSAAKLLHMPESTFRYKVKKLKENN